MMDITIGQYIRGNSLLHQLDPRTKMVGVFLLMSSLFLVNNPISFVVSTSFIIFILLLSQVPLSYYLKGLKPLIIIIIFTALIQLFLTPGEVIWSWYFLHLTREGIHIAFFMCSRLILLVLITSVLTLTTTPIALTDAIETLLNPFRRIGVPAHELAMMMSIALRFIPTLMEETNKIIKAQTARGVDFQNGSILDRARALLPVLVPLFVNSLKRADELALAMEARCYRGGQGRTRLHELSYEKKDYVVYTCLVAFMALIIAMRIFIPG